MVIGKNNSLFGMMLEVFAFNEVDKEESGKRNSEVN